MRGLKAVRTGLVLALLALSSYASLIGKDEQARQQTTLSWTPIAIAPLATFDGVAVLTRTGDVFQLGSSSTVLPPSSIGHIASGDPIDLGAGTFQGKDWIAVCSTAHTDVDPGSAALTIIEVQGGRPAGRQARPMKSLGATTCSGVFVDGRSGTAFASDMLTAKIHAFPLQLGSEGRVVGTFSNVGSNVLGTSLTLDAARSRLLIADEENGAIVELPLAGQGHARSVVSGLGDPRAVWVDQARSRLLIADATLKKVWQVAIDRSTGTLGRPAIFSAETSFREPSGLTVDSSGTVWVGDPSSQTVYRFSSAGTLLGKVTSSR